MFFLITEMSQQLVDQLALHLVKTCLWFINCSFAGKHTGLFRLSPGLLLLLSGLHPQKSLLASMGVVSVIL